MKGLGSGDNGEFTFIDLLAIFGFWIGVENYNMNLTQDDKQDLLEGLNKQSSRLLSEIHNHLKEQDKKIDLILEVLNERDKGT